MDPITTRTAAASDWHLAPMPGTDAALALTPARVAEITRLPVESIVTLGKKLASNRPTGISPAFPA